MRVRPALRGHAGVRWQNVSVLWCQVAAALGLAVLGAMLGANSDGDALVQALYATALPNQLLQDLQDAPHRALLQVRRPGQRLCRGSIAMIASGRTWQETLDTPPEVSRSQNSSKPSWLYEVLDGIRMCFCTGLHLNPYTLRACGTSSAQQWHSMQCGHPMQQLGWEWNPVLIRRSNDHRWVVQT